MIFLNYKTYELGTGKNAVDFTQVVQKIVEETQIKVIPVVQAGDINEISTATTLEIWAQKIDPYDFGAHTGSIIAEAVFEDGALGVCLNHSENRFDTFENLVKAHNRAHSVGLKTLIFAKDIEDLTQSLTLKPDYISYEPPELIGRSDVSVATAKPEIISLAVDISKKSGTPLIVGAGVHSADDVRKCLEFGATGIAVASDIMKSDNPSRELLDLIEGFK